MSTVAHATSPPAPAGRIRLDREACLDLLASVDTGALGLSIGALPVVMRVRFRVVDGHVLFRVSDDDGAVRALHHTVVALEVGGDHPVGEWSVLVQGPSHTAGPADGRHVLPGPGEHVVRLLPQLVTGYLRPLDIPA